jgi:hypothetical protein
VADKPCTDICFLLALKHLMSVQSRSTYRHSNVVISHKESILPMPVLVSLNRLYGEDVKLASWIGYMLAGGLNCGIVVQIARGGRSGFSEQHPAHHSLLHPRLPALLG